MTSLASLTDSDNPCCELIDHLTSGFAAFEPINEGNDFIIKECAGAVEEISGKDRNQVVGSKLTEAFPGLAENEFLETLQEVYETEEPIYTEEFDPEVVEVLLNMIEEGEIEFGDK